MLRGKALQVFFALLLLSASCQSATQEVLLRYAPQVGGTHDYDFAINRPHDPLGVSGKMHVLSRLEKGYETQFSGALGDELLAGLVLTYATNIFGYEKLVTRYDLYYPRFLRVEFDSAREESSP